MTSSSSALSRGGVAGHRSFCCPFSHHLSDASLWHVGQTPEWLLYISSLLGICTGATTMSNMQQALSKQERSTPLWRNRKFLVLVSGQGISSVGSQISLLAFPLLMLA